MSILPDWQIIAHGNAGMLEPLTLANINPASVDLTLAADVVYIGEQRSATIEGDLLILPGFPVIVSTVERITLPSALAGMVVLKSSMGRMGISLANAGWVDPGFSGTLSLTLYALVPARIAIGRRFCQLIVYRMASAPDALYNGKYQNQIGPTGAR
jgi:dCTP deaminase